MNSNELDDVGRERLAFETANHLRNLLSSTQNITKLHRELLEVNLSVIAYIRESKRRLEALKLESALKAKDSFEVVDRLSNNFPPTPIKKKQDRAFLLREQIARLESGEPSVENEATKFALWFHKMIDEDRTHLKPYLADDVVFHGFGRKVSTKDKVADYLINVLSPTVHYFTSIRSIDKIDVLCELEKDTDTSVCSSATESNTPGSEKRVLRSKKKVVTSTPKKRKALRRKRSLNNSQDKPKRKKQNSSLSTQYCDNDKGDVKDAKLDVKFDAITPPNREMGQGDCLPSTDTSTKSKTQSANTLISAQIALLPRSYVECEGYVRMENEDKAFREKKFSLQLAYSDDPFDVGEYIVFGIFYRNDLTCRKNLLPLFESVAEMNN